MLDKLNKDYKLILEQKEETGTNIALLYNDIKKEWVVAYAYNSDRNDWGQGHYFNSLDFENNNVEAFRIATDKFYEYFDKNKFNDLVGEEYKKSYITSLLLERDDDILDSLNDEEYNALTDILYKRLENNDHLYDDIDSHIRNEIDGLVEDLENSEKRKKILSVYSIKNNVLNSNNTQDNDGNIKNNTKNERDDL